MVRLEGLWKTYDNVVAVRDLTLYVGKGETLGLIGPNGAGKTTLLRMLTTLAKPDSGTVHIKGIDAVARPGDVRRILAFMPAEFGFPKQFSIGEYMEYFACLVGVPLQNRQKMITQVLELTDLAGREDVGVRGLSTGNRQRLLLAKTLLNDPELLVLDEPASGLDPRARAEVRVILNELSAMGKTIIISSHILADIQDICSHVCIIEAGERVLSGEIGQLLDTRQNTERIVHLEFPPDQLDQAQGIIEVLKPVISCSRSGAQLAVSSSQVNCNYILRSLIEQNIEILGMKEEKPNLEDIFLESTQGKVT